MPHATLKLTPGIDQNETPALNQAGVSSSNLIRYVLDRQQGGLIQKLGGWTKFYATQMAAKVRAMWAWADTGSVNRLAVGTENIGVSGQAQLGVITNGILTDVTPRYVTDNVAVSFTTVINSSTVKIDDATTVGITNYDTVYITTHVSVGGIVLFGLYQCDPDLFSAAAQYTIFSTDQLGSPLAANANVAAGGAVAKFTTAVGTSSVNVLLNDHRYVVGDTYPILIQTAVGGVTLLGNYTVQNVVDPNNFTIYANNTASSAVVNQAINGGDVRFIYSFESGALPGGTGYGIGGYGSGGYGTGTAVTPALGNPIPASDWTLDNWGSVLIACPSFTVESTVVPFQPLYQWDPFSGNPTAAIITTASPVNDGFFVAMPQRQIVAWGSSVNGVQDPLLVRWCDVNNHDQWIPLVTNQAGSYRIPRGSKIVGGIQGPQQGYIWTDIAAWSMQYINQPYVYSFNQIGSGCGLIAKKAAAIHADDVYWMSQSQFFILSGDGISPLPCPIWDVIFQNLDQNNVSKIRVGVNARFAEVSWYYPSTSGGGEVDSYVKYNAALSTWDYGSLARSAWIDQSVFGPPIGADPTSLYLYQHETSTDADGAAMASSFQTGWFTLADGDVMTFVDQMWPDMKWGYYNGTQNATVNITFYVADYPTQTPQIYGPFSVTQATQMVEPRFRGRLVSIKFSSSDIGSFWRVGAVRYRYSPDGQT